MVRIWCFHCWSLGSIPDQRIKILQTKRCRKKIKVSNKGQFNMATVATVVVCVRACTCAHALDRGKAGGTWRSPMIKVSFMPCKKFGLYPKVGEVPLNDFKHRKDTHTHTHTHTHILRKAFLNIPVSIYCYGGIHGFSRNKIWKVHNRMLSFI